MLVVGSFYLFEESANINVYAQNEDKVSLAFSEAQFFPYTEDRNLLEIMVDYKTNDLSLIDSTINGEMLVFSPDGILLKSTSYPEGFIITDEGKIGFRTSIMDDSLDSVTANIKLTNLEETEAISNSIQITVPFNDDEDLDLLIPNP
ncbi:MAG: hypothetical protein L0H53_15590 [Candidatus Nitrosocosmicus sp.]|nr:hypothetical protein [Candidatus Nitrosocosmicus sp.]MDN5867853.1 hypothetical protein [Candidatus Nitrosocosmicus sp.]